MNKLIFLLLLLLLSSCKPECETDNTGQLTIKNQTSTNVTGFIDDNIPFTLTSGQTFTRTLTAGSYNIDAINDNGFTISSVVSVIECEEREVDLIR